MRKRFIIAVDSSTPEQNSAFTAHLKAENLAWWHWINNFWLIVDEYGTRTAGEIRSDLKNYFPGENNIVLELREDGCDTWAGYGPSTGEHSMFPWLKNTWKSKHLYNVLRTCAPTYTPPPVNKTKI